MEKEYYFFIGTVAEFIKIIPVIREFKKRKTPYGIILSGQTKLDLKEFMPLVGKQKIYHSFRFKGKKSSPFLFATWAIKTFLVAYLWTKKNFIKKRKENEIIFIVQGDAISTVIGAVVAKLNGFKLAHIESGLRSFNFLEPFPEELSRYLISFISDLHFCPGKYAIRNLARRSGRKVNTYENTGVESFQTALTIKKKPQLLNKLTHKKFFILFVHRQEHLFFRKQSIKAKISQVLAKASPNLICVFIIPRVTLEHLFEFNAEDFAKDFTNIYIVPRFPYLEFVQVLKASSFIVSDGGGNQPESYYLGKPLLILRKKTEQKEGIGKNAILSKEDPKIIDNFLENYTKYNRKGGTIFQSPSKIIVDNLLKA